PERADSRLDSDYNVVHQAKDVACGADTEVVRSGPHDLCQDPRLTGLFSGPAFGLMLGPGSPAIDRADDALCPPVDFLGHARPVDGDGDGVAACDRGAYEWRPATVWLHLPLVRRDR
ncbi:MAG: hypothetical protein H5T59_08450, partial [Anaerolineae bacterium]|nr:hypothetical protein [Anaerolineae bacterium]